MKKILVPTDFSDCAYNALLYATQLFQEEPAQFYLLHSFEEEVAMLTTRIDIGRAEVVVDNLYKDCDRKLTALKHSITLHTTDLGHSFETICSSKMLTSEINFMITGSGADLVVMGTKGLTGAKEVLLGSNTVKTIKQITGCPLLVIPETTNFQSPKNIGFATGFTHDYKTSEIEILLAMAREHKASVTVLYVWKDEKLTAEQHINLEALREKLVSINSEFYRLTMGKSKSATLVDFIQGNETDMLAMIYYKHGFIQDLFRESVVKRIGRHPEIPLLVIPAAT